MVNVLLTDFKF